MLPLSVLLAIGNAVSSGAFATKEVGLPNGAGLVSTKKGAEPVCVGPSKL